MLSLTQQASGYQYWRLADKLDQFLIENPSTRPLLRYYLESVLRRCRQQCEDDIADTPE